MSLSTLNDKERTFDRFSHNVPNKDLPTGIFTYYDDPKIAVPAIDVIQYGRFIIENDCLFFKSENTLSTPIFPIIYTRYKEDDTKIHLDGVDISIGENLEIHAFPSRRLGTEEFVTKGSDDCLMENISKVNPFSYYKFRY